ncbi:hypothetical protein ACP275_14G021500 [Erythranthe tilingii]
MGNQSTSGIVEEAAKVTNEAREVSSPNNSIQENQTLIQEDDIKDFQEKTSSSVAVDSADADADADADTSHPIERLTSGEKEVSEERPELAGEDCETQAVVLQKESEFEEQISKIDNEVEDQPYTLKGEMQRSESNSNSITTSNSNPSPRESVDIATQPQEDQNMLEKEIAQTLEHVESCLVVVDDHDVEIENSPVIALDGLQSIDSQDLSALNNDEQNDRFALKNDEQNDGFALKNDEQNDGFALDEEKPMINEIDNIGDNTSCADQEIKKNKEEVENAVEIIDSVCCLNSFDDNIKTEDQEDEKLTVELSETHVLVQDNEIKTETVVTETKVELRKSPSFDFGLPFVAMREESERTPLLYQERPKIRSLSTSSTMRFQNRSVQTEILGSSLRYEAVEVEEKTIRMEGGKSERSEGTIANLENKEVTIAKQEDCAVVTSPKGNGKRKPKSSLFTTCMCCAAAIS